MDEADDKKRGKPVQLSHAIKEVLNLQPQYSSANTEAMQRRGYLVRRTIPDELRLIKGELSAVSGIALDDLLIEGRDGTGLKSEVPWVRIASKAVSPSATTGWYVVLLHRGDGSGVFLALGHGSTQFNNGALVARSDSELLQLMDWGRATLKGTFSQQPRLTRKVELRTKGPLAASYEKACVAAFYYDAGDLPSDSALREDIVTMAGLLGRLYEAERLGQTPLSPSPEIRDAEAAASSISRPTSQGQGLALTGAERRAVELHAMTMATQHLVALGFDVNDVSRTKPFDLEARRCEELIHVEVKGSTSQASAILLTVNEVELHKSVYPANALVVVLSIRLDRSGIFPVASGGELKMWLPWLVEDERLRGVTYAYQLP